MTRDRGWRRLLGLARVVFSLTLLTYVLTKVDWSSVAGYRHSVSPGWLAGFVASIAVGHLLSAAKWRMLLAAAGHRVGFWRLTGLYLVGQFYNAVFPSTIGGDVVRSLGLRRVIGDAQIAFASTVAERLTGAVVLVLLGSAATLVALPSLLETADGIVDGRLAAGLAVTAIGATTVAMVAILSPRTLEALRAIFARVGWVQPWIFELERFQDALRAYRRKANVMALALGYSLVFYATIIVTIYSACRMIGAPGADVGWLDAAVVTPIILLIALLPLTPGGYGVVQWGYMVTFAALGVGEATDAATLGVFVSLMVTACNIGLSAAGYALYSAFSPLATSASPADGTGSTT